jgi:nucleoside 2-deoxyribosyltransferase
VSLKQRKVKKLLPEIYIAGPLFNSGERDQNLRIKAILEPHFLVHLPQLDGALLPSLLKAGMPPYAARRRIFEDDVAAVRRCNVLLIVLNGRAVDEGAAFELGLAWSLGKLCFGFKDDFRQLVADGDNPMIQGALNTIFGSFDDLAAWATEFTE